ncbi:MAG: peroxiredoxin [Colwellia sp.]
MSLTNNAFSNTSIDVGSTIGKKVAKISVINPLKQQVNIKQLSGDQGLIILFFGSADWCSFCKKHLIALNNQAEKFITLDYGLVVISYDNTNILKSFY